MKYYIMALLMALSFTLSGCAGVGGANYTENQSVRILIQYSVLKASEESDKIDRASILAVTSKIKSLINDNDKQKSITLTYVSSEIKNYISYSSLAPSDKMLVDLLMVNIEQVITNRIETDVIDANTEERVIEIIELIEQAAYMAEA